MNKKNPTTRCKLNKAKIKCNSTKKNVIQSKSNAQKIKQTDYYSNNNKKKSKLYKTNSKIHKKLLSETFRSQQQQLLLQKKESEIKDLKLLCEQLEIENHRYQLQNFILKNREKSPNFYDKSLTMQKCNSIDNYFNNTSSNFPMKSEILEKWEKFAKIQILDSFIDFENSPELIYHLLSELIILNDKMIKKYCITKYEGISKIMGVQNNSYNLKDIEINNKNFIKEHLNEIFKDLRGEKFINEYKANYKKIIIGNVIKSDDEVNLIIFNELLESSEFIEMLININDIILFTQFNEPTLFFNLETDYQKRKSLYYKININNKKKYIIVNDTGIKSDTEYICILLLAPPILSNGYYLFNEMKPILMYMNNENIGCKIQNETINFSSNLKINLDNTKNSNTTTIINDNIVPKSSRIIYENNQISNLKSINISKEYKEFNSDSSFHFLTVDNDCIDEVRTNRKINKKHGIKKRYNSGNNKKIKIRPLFKLQSQINLDRFKKNNLQDNNLNNQFQNAITYSKSKSQNKKNSILNKNQLYNENKKSNKDSKENYKNTRKTSKNFSTNVNTINYSNNQHKKNTKINIKKNKFKRNNSNLTININMNNYLNKKQDSNNKAKTNFNDIYIKSINTTHNINNFKNIKNFSKIRNSSNLDIANYNRNKIYNAISNRTKLKPNFGSFEQINSINYQTIDVNNNKHNVESVYKFLNTVNSCKSISKPFGNNSKNNNKTNYFNAINSNSNKNKNKRKISVSHSNNIFSDKKNLSTRVFFPCTNNKNEKYIKNNECYMVKYLNDRKNICVSNNLINDDSYLTNYCDKKRRSKNLNDKKDNTLSTNNDSRNKKINSGSNNIKMLENEVMKINTNCKMSMIHTKGSKTIRYYNKKNS